MGAHDYIRVYRTDSRDEVRKKWKAQVDEDSAESGHGAYAGNATTMHGDITFHDLKLANEEASRKHILDKHQKWSGPIAVSFYLPAEPGKRDQARVEKALAAVEKVEEKMFAAAMAIQAAFVGRQAKLVTCSVDRVQSPSNKSDEDDDDDDDFDSRHAAATATQVKAAACGSKLSREHLVKKLGRGSAHTYPSRPGERAKKTFNFPAMPVCPLCQASLLSETDQKRLAAHKAKVGEARKAYEEARRPPASDKLGWAIGGWAAS